VNEIIKLLEDKNFWYRKYLACTEAFLVALRHAPEIALDEIELFYGNRESLLKILDSLDKKIEEQAAECERMGFEPNSEQNTRLQYQVRERTSIVEKITLLDQEMMAEIEVLRKQGDEKLKLLAKGKKALSKYKSTGNQNEKIDKRV
jgi:hypothetical protein